MAYGDSQDLHRRTAADKVLGDKVFHIAKNPNNVGHQRGMGSMVYKFFDKKLQVEKLKMKLFLIKN